MTKCAAVLKHKSLSRYLGQYSEYSNSGCIQLSWGKEACINIPKGINSTYVHLLSTSSKTSQILPGKEWMLKG